MIQRNISEDKFEHFRGVSGAIAVVRLGCGAESNRKRHTGVRFKGER